MVKAPLFVTVLLATATVAEAAPRYITIDTDALGTAGEVAAAQGGVNVLEAQDGVAVVELAADADLEALSHAMHEQHGRCGGFMVHDTLADAQAALTVQDGGEPIEYTLDRAEVVHHVLPALNKARIRDTIGTLSSMPNRHYQSATGAAASEWLHDRWLTYARQRKGATVELFDQGYPQKSVILTIPGTTRAHEVVVIGGHLDSIALGGRGANAPGADDDASGIATLDEVARALVESDFRPARTIEFIAYAAEEVGLRGSQAVVRDHQKRGVQVVGALQLDMTNYQGSEKDIWLMKDFTSAAQNAFLIQLIETYVGATYGLDACGYACSDHASWYRAGVPASMPFESRSADRNRSIHTKNDTLERSHGNADHALKFARLAAAYAVELAKGDIVSGDGAAMHAAEAGAVMGPRGCADAVPAESRGCERDAKWPLALVTTLLLVLAYRYSDPSRR